MIRFIVKNRNLALPVTNIARNSFHRTYRNSSEPPSEVTNGTSQINTANVPIDIKLSDTCVQRLKVICADSDSFLRLTVEGGGCSGFQYKFDLDRSIQTDDVIVEREGSKIVIDSTSLEYVNGSTIDFKSELIKSAFTVAKNPNATQGCSCGASFTINV